MKLGIVVNNVMTEKRGYTTTHIALAATNRGHEVWYMGVDNFAFGPEEHVCAHARQVQMRHYRNVVTYTRSLHDESAIQERISLDQLDVLLLRNDPAEDVNKRPWARLAGINFGRLAKNHGVIVLNDPDGLAQAVNKMYLLLFPPEVRPTTLISCDRHDIKAFIRELGGYAVIKPLAGSGGRNVFLITPSEAPNLNSMIDAVSTEGYVVVQEYLPDAIHGDTRMFVVNAQPFIVDGVYAAIQRVRSVGDVDMRSNLSAGAISNSANVTEKMLEVAEIIRPRLIQDGMFMVGLDIVKDKLMEINVFSPGGMQIAERLYNAHFAREIVCLLEHKVEYRHQHRENFNNVEIATAAPLTSC
ncbi:MAG: glutathione synthase [Burkholderiales bacterium]|nr:hypothetical protein [Nitrosomonas sp.]MCP5274444.1 glutathione synthase [Burkholderiales bacterium]